MTCRTFSIFPAEARRLVPVRGPGAVDLPHVPPCPAKAVNDRDNYPVFPEMEIDLEDLALDQGMAIDQDYLVMVIGQGYLVTATDRDGREMAIGLDCRATEIDPDDREMVIDRDYPAMGIDQVFLETVTDRGDLGMVIDLDGPVTAIALDGLEMGRETATGQDGPVIVTALDVRETVIARGAREMATDRADPAMEIDQGDLETDPADLETALVDLGIDQVWVTDRASYRDGQTGEIELTIFAIDSTTDVTTGSIATGGAVTAICITTTAGGVTRATTGGDGAPGARSPAAGFPGEPGTNRSTMTTAATFTTKATTFT